MEPDRKDYIIITTSIIGASVCPPNFFLHSALVPARSYLSSGVEKLTGSSLNQKRPFVHNSVCSQFLEGLFAILAECSHSV